MIKSFLEVPPLLTTVMSSKEDHLMVGGIFFLCLREKFAFLCHYFTFLDVAVDVNLEGKARDDSLVTVSDNSVANNVYVTKLTNKLVYTSTYSCLS